MYTWQSLLFTSLHQHIHVEIDDLWEDITCIKIDTQAFHNMKEMCYMKEMQLLYYYIAYATVS